jgi:maleate cis-trans isomerase
MIPRDGDPVHVGLIVAANNTTMQGELLSWLPPGSTCVTRRVAGRKGLLTRETIADYQDASFALAKDFPAGLDVIAYGCTAAGAIAGPTAEAAMAARIEEVTGAPVVTSARAMVDALLAIGASEVDLVTPYSDAVDDDLCAYLDSVGIAAGRIERLLAPDLDALGRLTAEDVIEAAHRLIGTQSDAIFIACSQLPTSSVLMPLRAACGKPVLSAIQATASQAVLAARMPPGALPSC